MFHSVINPFHSGYWYTDTLANNADQDEMLNNPAFDQGLHRLLRLNATLGTEIQHFIENLQATP